MKLKDLITARKTILSLKEERIPSCVAYKLMKIVKASNDEEAFYDEKIKEIIEEYSIKDQEDKTKIVNGEFRIRADKFAEFNKAIRELEETEVEQPKTKLHLSDLEDIKISVADIYALDSFIEE